MTTCINYFCTFYVDFIAVLCYEVCFHLNQDLKVESYLCDQPELTVDNNLDMR